MATLLWVGLFIKCRAELVRKIRLSRRGNCKCEMGAGIWINILDIVCIISMATNTGLILQELNE